MRRLIVAALVSVACRTTVEVGHAPPGKDIFRAPGAQCQVHDYATATDVPDGAKNLGWVQVPKENTDEETYVKLREAICEKGGNALSQLRWLNETSKDAPFVFAIEANAWALPVDDMNAK